MHGFFWFLGVYPVPSGTSAMYQLWSGVVPSLVIIGALGATVRWARGHTCHVTRCWRIGRYEAGQYKVCWRHHPSDDPPVRHVTPAHVKRAWNADPQHRSAVLQQAVSEQRAAWDSLQRGGGKE